MPKAAAGALSIVVSFSCLSARAQSPACQAPAEIERALATQPSAEAYNALGAWFAQRNHMACAIPAFQSAIRLRPGAWDGHFNLALALMNDRDFKQAISELRQADKLSPGRAPVHTALGIALQESGQLPAAETELKAALALDPRSGGGARSPVPGPRARRSAIPLPSAISIRHSHSIQKMSIFALPWRQRISETGIRVRPSTRWSSSLRMSPARRSRTLIWPRFTPRRTTSVCPPTTTAKLCGSIQATMSRASRWSRHW